MANRTELQKGLPELILDAPGQEEREEGMSKRMLARLSRLFAGATAFLSGLKHSSADARDFEAPQAVDGMPDGQVRQFNVDSDGNAVWLERSGSGENGTNYIVKSGLFSVENGAVVVAGINTDNTLSDVAGELIFLDLPSGVSFSSDSGYPYGVTRFEDGVSTGHFGDISDISPGSGEGVVSYGVRGELFTTTEDAQTIEGGVPIESLNATFGEEISVSWNGDGTIASVVRGQNAWSHSNSPKTLDLHECDGPATLDAGGGIATVPDCNPVPYQSVDSPHWGTNSSVWLAEQDVNGNPTGRVYDLFFFANEDGTLHAIKSQVPPDEITDTDRDGLMNNVDNCPDLANAGQEDADVDEIGDVCDLCPADGDNDSDLDGVCLASGNPDLGTIGGDNCINQANPSQADLDEDEIGDACDLDADGDGIPDAIEAAGCGDDADCVSCVTSTFNPAPDIAPPNPLSFVDTNRDSVPDACNSPEDLGCEFALTHGVYGNGSVTFPEGSSFAFMPINSGERSDVRVVQGHNPNYDGVNVVMGDVPREAPNGFTWVGNIEVSTNQGLQCVVGGESDGICVGAGDAPLSLTITPDQGVSVVIEGTDGTVVWNGRMSLKASDLVTPTPVSTETPEATPTPTPESPTPSPLPSPTPSEGTPTPTPTPSDSSTPAPTPTPSESAVPTPIPTEVGVSTPTPNMVSPTPSATDGGVNTPDATPASHIEVPSGPKPDSGCNATGQSPLSMAPLFAAMIVAALGRGKNRRRLKSYE